MTDPVSSTQGNTPAQGTAATEGVSSDARAASSADAFAQIPDPVFGCDPVTQALATIARLTATHRDAMREIRDQRERAAIAQGQSEVQALRAKAGAMRTGAIVSGSLAIGGATLSMASAIKSFDGPSAAALDRDATRLESQGMGASAQRAAFARLQTAEDQASRIAREQRVLDASAKAVDGMSGPLQGYFNAEAENRGADAAMANNARAELDRVGGRAHEDARSAEQLLRQVFDAVRSVDETRHATELSIINITA